MTNKTTNTPPFKVKCIYIDNDYLTVGKEYNVVEIDEGFYEVKNDSGEFWWYYNNRFQIVETPKDKQEFSVGDKMVINKISDDFVSGADKNVKVGDIATVTVVESRGEYDVRLTNPNWERGWWFSKSDVSLANGTLSHQEVVQAVLEDKRKAVIKKLLENKVAVLCKCWDDDGSDSAVEAITSIDDDNTYPYMNNCLAYKYAYAIHDNGDEITNV